MQKGKRGAAKKHPNYVGIFAFDAKQANKIVRGICKDTLLEIMKQINPESYLEQGEKPVKGEKIYEHERPPIVQEVQQVERDLLQFEEFKSPADNYHLTCLYIGNKIEKLNKKQQLLYKEWKEGHKQTIKVDFIVYVPNYIMAAYVSDVGEVDVDNSLPHMTLLLKSGTSAVESNTILELLSKYHPQLLKSREKHIIPLHIPFKGSQLVFVIDRQFVIEGICGNNHTHGRC